MIRKISDWFMTHRLPIIVMASVIVIITTYMLVLPAFTLTFEKAKEQGGISVDSLQSRSEDSKSAQAEAPAKDSDESESSAAVSDEEPGKDSGADQSKDEGKDSSEDESKDSGADQSKDSEAKAENTDEKSEAAQEGKDEQKEDNETEDNDEEEDEEEPEYKEMVLSSVLNDKEKVTVKISKDAKVPEGSSLVVSELLAGKDAQKAKKEISEEESKADVTEITQSEYDSYINESEKVLGWDDKSAANARMLDIKIVDKDGKKVKIAAPVDVKIELLDEGKNNDLSIVHFADVEYKAAKEENNTDDQAKGEFKSRDEVIRSGEIQAADASKVQDLIAHSGKLSFEADGFSVYVIVGTTIEKTILASDGNNYKISVTYGSDTGIPVNADLDVEELTKDISDYDSYVKRTEDAIGVEEGSASYIRLFDIKIVNKDDHSIKYQPVEGTTVDVRIELADAEDREELNVVHFADGSEKGEKLNNNTESINEGQAVEFEADGFSVYAVVDGSTDDHARMKVEFYSEGNLIATMYVKNGDTANELETILYDPGVGDLEQDEVFDGWILDKPEYTTADLNNAMTIADIRQWAEGLQITEGDTHRFDAAICKLYKITYKDDDGTVLGLDSIPVIADDYGSATAPAVYTVSMAYTPKDDVHNFEGWKLDAGSVPNVTSAIPEDRIYENDNTISIKGDISFTVNAPEGRWLVFDENGKGGKYNAPQFVKADEVTHEPCAPADMTRNGYEFGGWYTKVSDVPDAHGYHPVDETSRFTFGNELTANTTLYAKWTPVQRAPYTVVLWGQKMGPDGPISGEYEVLGSYTSTHRVGQNIPYTVVENKDEDYVTGVGNNNGHYTGFCLTDGSKNQQVAVTPEGDAVLNLYYDRTLYNFKFYLYRDGTQNNRYDYANNSGSGRALNDLVTWHSNQSQHPSISGRTIQSEVVGGRTYYYFTLPAYYGQDISALWPKYNEITGANNREAVSFVMMVGTKLKPNPSSGGDGTVKGIVTVMDENILGATNDTNGNYIVIRFPDSYYNWRYHIWFETVEGEDYTGKNTHTWNGVTYYEIDDSPLVVRSSNTTVTNQNAPKYQGFDFIDWRGQNWNNRNYWTQGSNPTQYHINEVYSREKFKISYFDGNYVDGTGTQLDNRSQNLLRESPEIPLDMTIADEYINYVPDPPVEGFVFDGWYIDEACTVEYNWDKMPMGGIVVYAKWVQKQYRVFLHPNAGTDPSLDWGSSTVQTSFRVDYGGKVSTPTGTRPNSGYAFVGWYTKPGMTPDSLYVASTVLNDTTVTTPYDQTEDTELDKWGNTEEGREGYNSDAVNDRFWVTNKLDLYAKWRMIIDDAEGISVVYTADDGKGHAGTHPPEDPTLYPDQAFAPAQGASTAPDGYYFKCWVVQTWDATANKYVDTDVTVYPGEKYTVDVGHAHKEPIPGQEGKYTYTMQLRAEYVEAESEFPTHIWWFNNYSDSEAARHESARQDEGILINEAKDIQAAPTREGYTFEGWARVPINISESEAGADPGDKATGKVLDYDTVSGFLYLKYENGQFKLNDTSSTYNGRVVNQVAADERQLYHDMYAVWKPNTFTVTVKKTVDSEDQLDKMKDFVFTPNTALAEYAPEGSLVGGKFKLKDSQTLVFEDVPFNTVISLAETIDPDFAPSATKTVTTNSKGEPIPHPTPEPITLSGGSTGNIKVKGSMVIEYTNTPSTKIVSVWKTNEDHTKLTGASFELYKAEDYDDTTGQPKPGRTPVVESTPVDTNGLLPLGILPNGEYRLVETVTPAGYDPAESAIKIFVTVNAVTAMQGTSNSEVYRYPSQYMVPDQDPETWQIRVWNNPGVELPHTGGSGVTWIYFAGIMMILMSGAALVINRRGVRQIGE